MTRKTGLTFALAAIVLVAIWFAALWRPTTRALAAAQAQLSAAQNDQASIAAKHTSLLRERRMLPAEELLAQQLTQAAPADAGIADMIDQIAAVARRSGVALKSESQTVAGGAAAPGTISSLTPIGLSMSVAGTYGQVLDFVGLLQATPRLIKVTSLSLAGSTAAATPGPPVGAPGQQAPSLSGGDGPGTLTTTITATMYTAPAALPPPPRTGH